MVEIVDYAEQYADVFKKINLEWLDQYGLTEAPDLLMLNEPITTIVKPGGAVFLAKINDEIIGSAALIHSHDGIYELAKMTVVPVWRGKGISKLLLTKCLDRARHFGAKKIVLFSNHKLKSALQLYTKFGFVNVAVTDSPFVTADIKMELLLD